MLSWQSIGELIKNGKPCDQTFLESLKKLSEKHPYSQTFSILYLNGLAANNDVSFDEELEKHSYRIFDRVQLYNLIHEQEVLTDAKIIPIAKKDSPPIENTDQKQKADHLVSNSENNQIKKDKPKQVIKADIEKKEESKDESDKLKIKKAETTLSAKKPTTKNKEEEENSIPEKKTDPSEINKDANIAKTDKETEQANTENSNKELIQENKETKEDKFNKTVLAEVYKSSFQISDSETEKTEKIEEIENRFDKEIDLSIVETEINELKKETLDSSTNTPKTFNSWLSSSEEDSNINHVQPKKLIYLEFDKPKKEFYSASKKAKESLLEKKLPISETLAIIHASQGNINKAIKIYEQLQLVFPEKKVFFARQIKKLRSK